MSTTSVNVTATATLTDSLGNAISGETIYFAYKLLTDTSYTAAGSIVTNSSGQASKPLSLLTPDMYDVQATFNGDASWQANSVVKAYTTSGGQISTILTATVDASDIMSGQLTDASNNPLAGESIQINLDGTNVAVETTATDGTYSYPISTYGLADGNHTATAYFAGNATYLSHSASATFTISTGGGMGYGGLGFPANIVAAINNANQQLYNTLVTLPIIGPIIPPPPLLPAT